MEKPNLMLFDKDEESMVHLYAELNPATLDDDGYIKFRMEDLGKLDTEALMQSLDIDALGAMLLVLRGKCVYMDESEFYMDDDNAALSLRREFSPGSQYIIKMRHLKNDRTQELKLTDTQACGLEAAISSSMTFVAFGIPKYN